MAPGLYFQLLSDMSLPRRSWHAKSELNRLSRQCEISKGECRPLLELYTYSHLLPALSPFRDCRTETGLFESRRPCGSAAGRRPDAGAMPMTRICLLRRKNRRRGILWVEARGSRRPQRRGHEREAWLHHSCGDSAGSEPPFQRQRPLVLQIPPLRRADPIHKQPL